MKTDIAIPENISLAMRRLRDNGISAYLVGGCVRDSVMGKKPHDYDIAASSLPAETVACFADFEIIRTGMKHGTVAVIIGHEAVEITTFRTDGDYADNRHPQSVTFTGNIQEDLARRDFTVNAMAASTDGEIIDPFCGMRDIENRIIACVGDPDRRFSEDGLRILRALRFSSVLDFDIAPETAESIHKNFRLLKNISAERIFFELKGIITGARAEKILREYSDAVTFILPELALSVGMRQNNPHHIYNVYDHIAVSVGAAENDMVIRLAMLLHDCGKPLCKTTDAEGTDHFHGHPEQSAQLARQALLRLKADTATINGVCLLISYHDYRFPAHEKSIRRLLRHIGYDDMRRLMLVKRADLKAQAPGHYEQTAKLYDEIDRLIGELEKADVCLTVRQLEVDGNDIMSLGASGKTVGKILEALLTEVSENGLQNSREVLIKKAAEMLNNV